MADLPPTARDAFGFDYRAAMQAVRSGVVPSSALTRDTHWLRWQDYCSSLDIPPTLDNYPHTIAALQVFAHRYRTGVLAPSGQPVRARTVEAALRAIGQTLSSMGSPDPRLDSQNNIHYVLLQQLRGYSREDDPPTRVKPIPFTLIQHLSSLAATPLSTGVADMSILGFFFLLRPGEHTAASAHSDSSPFTLSDVTFRTGGHLLPAHSGDLQLIRSATFVTLRFRRQKNGTTNELIGHARSGHPTVCPVLALIRRTQHLRHFLAAPDTPLCTVFTAPLASTSITSQHLTTALRSVATTLYPITGFPASDVSARALRAGGAMALLCARVDDNIIKLVGRWRSDQMLRYLHLQAYPQMHTFAPLMVTGGTFRLLHNQPLPAPALPLLAQVPDVPDPDEPHFQPLAPP